VSRQASAGRAGQALCVALLVVTALVPAGCAPLPPARTVHRSLRVVSGTIARIGLLGHACAQAPATLKRTMAQASIKRRMSTSLTVADRRNADDDWASRR